MIALVLAAAIPACVQAQDNDGRPVPGLYLPTPSPCVVTITDPRTGKPEALVLRLMVEKPKRMRLGKWPLESFRK